MVYTSDAAVNVPSIMAVVLPSFARCSMAAFALIKFGELTEIVTTFGSLHMIDGVMYIRKRAANNKYLIFDNMIELPNKSYRQKLFPSLY